MDKQILTTLITSVFSLAAALGSVWLKDLLERRRLSIPSRPTAANSRPAPAIVQGWTWKRPLLVFFTAFIFGLITRLLRPLFQSRIHWESLIAVVLLVVAALGMAIDHRQGSRFWPYELEVLALWMAWASGWSAVEGTAWTDLIILSFLWWLGCAAIGGLIVIAGKRKVPVT